MRYSIWGLAGVLVTAGVAGADVFHLPVWQKIVTVEHTVHADKEYPEYTFFLTSKGSRPVLVKLAPKQPISFKGTRRGKDQVLVAVPAAARKKYATEEDYERAVGESRIEGMVRANETLFSWILIPVADKRDTVIRNYKLVKIDPKDGVILEMKEAKTTDKDGGIKGLTRVGEYTPAGGSWFAGLAASLGLSLGGLWFAGRARRRA
jgi:hypothetical protein